MVKDSPRTTAGELQKIVESRVQKSLNKKIVKQHLHHHMLFGNYPSSSKNKHIQLSDTTGTSNGTGFYGQMKQKKSFLAANTQDGFGEHGDIIFRHMASRILLLLCTCGSVVEHCISSTRSCVQFPGNTHTDN